MEWIGWNGMNGWNDGMNDEWNGMCGMNGMEWSGMDGDGVEWSDER